MQKLHRHVSTRSRNPVTRLVNENTPQTRKARVDQVKNSAGGFAFSTGPFVQLERFLILGTEGGSFYATERKLTIDNTKALDACLAANHKLAVDLIIDKGQRAPKMDPILFAYARACSTGSDSERAYALSRLPEVCRIGTHLFMFMEYAMAFRGTGSGLRKAINNWYLSRAPRDVAFQVTKYAQRNGWSHADMIRLGHPSSKDEDMNFAFNYTLWDQGFKKAKEPKFVKRFGKAETAREYLSIVHKAKNEDSISELVKLIGEYRLPREVLPTESLKSPKVWQALLDADMPTTALIRNLGNLSSCGLLVRGDKDVIDTVCKKIDNEDTLRRSRIHPIALLVAYKTYKQGHGDKGSKTWTPVASVVDALESAFYKSFGTIEPTGKKLLLAIDTSGSMDWQSSNLGIGLTSREAAAVMAMVTMRAEKGGEVYGFSTSLERLAIDADMRLDKVIRVMQQAMAGGTDCSLPALWALDKRRQYDGFVIYTDNETWAGRVHPYKALTEYRRQVSPNCRQVVVGFVASNITIADPRDDKSLDVVGFDVSTPEVISWFISQ